MDQEVFQNTRELAQKIKGLISIEDVLKTFNIDYSKSSERVKILCPIHRERTPSCSIDFSENLWYCFGCKQGGDQIELIKKVEKLESWGEVIKYIQEKYGIGYEWSLEEHENLLEKNVRGFYETYHFGMPFLETKKVAQSFEGEIQILTAYIREFNEIMGFSESSIKQTLDCYKEFENLYKNKDFDLSKIRVMRNRFENKVKNLKKVIKNASLQTDSGTT